MYSQLGNIVFKGLKGFDGFQHKRETNYAQHAVIEGKPRLQRIGDNLDEINLSIQFHASFCDPETEISALESARISGEILPLIGGSGEFFGNFVVQSYTRDVGDLGPGGNIMYANISVTLLEAVIADPVGAASLAAKMAGFGNAVNNPPQVVNTPRVQSEAAGIASAFTSAKAAANSAGNAIGKAKAVASQAAHYARRAQEQLKESRKALETANTRITEAKQVYQSAARMKQAIADTQTAISATLTALQGGNIDSALTANQELQKAVSRSSSASAEVVNITAYRG